ncbi:MAG: sugar phosphate isomerase/epimerase family protein [Planctomycetota bacterium]
MSKWPLGVFSSIDAGFGVPLEVANRLAVPTIHLHCPTAEFRTDEVADEFRDRVAKCCIRVTCVFAGFEGESYADIPTVKRTVGLMPRQTRDHRAREFMQIAEFARLLEVDVVGLHIGFVPHDPQNLEYQRLVRLTQKLCDDCAARAQAIHLETGQEPAEVLMRFIEDVGCQNLYINFDPANMILYGCGEPLDALKQVGPYVRSVHCKDAIWSDRPGETWGTEVPLGTGDVNIASYLATLEAIGYTGPLTIEREISQEPERQQREIGQAVQLLSDLMQKIGA